jgi:hypothetical protein
MAKIDVNAKALRKWNVQILMIRCSIKFKILSLHIMLNIMIEVNLRVVFKNLY